MRQSLPELTAYVVTCSERQASLKRTLTALRSTDWGAEPVIQLDTGSVALSREVRITANWFRVLKRVAAGGAGCALVIEDDVAINRHVRHNLSRWPPLGNQMIFGSVYNGSQPPPWRSEEWPPGSSWFACDPGKMWGSQGVVLSSAMASYLVRHWHDEAGVSDTRMALLAGHVGPVYHHVPSLVQHVGERSTWSAPFHQASDFDPEWRAP